MGQSGEGMGREGLGLVAMETSRQGQGHCLWVIFLLLSSLFSPASSRGRMKEITFFFFFAITVFYLYLFFLMVNVFYVVVIIVFCFY